MIQRNCNHCYKQLHGDLLRRDIKIHIVVVDELFNQKTVSCAEARTGFPTLCLTICDTSGNKLSVIYKISGLCNS